MAEIVEFLAEEQLQVGQVVRVDKKKLTVADERERPHKVAPDKVLFRHQAPALAALLERLTALVDEVDVELLWEAWLAEEQPGAVEAPALARLFFEEDDALHCSAVFRALVEEKLRFRRRGRAFEARSAEEVEQLQQQRAAEARAAAELDAVRQALASGAIDDELADRLLAAVQGKQADRALLTVLGERAKDPASHAFNLLVGAGRVAASEDREVLAAGLKREHPPAVLEAAERAAWDPAGEPPLVAGFSIDDPETREVDDVLSVAEEQGLVRVAIDIADAARLIAAGDPVDREALKRATTVYLPTGTYYMVPEVIGAQRASLHAGAPRPALRTTVWIDPSSGEVARFELARCVIEVGRRLDYEQADALISEGAADDATAVALRRLEAVAGKLRARRKAHGAFTVSRKEWKIRVGDDGEISAKEIPADSPSRALVAEMMILANGLAAALAVRERIPLIFRVQPPPDAPLPEIAPGDPAAFARLRGQLAAAKLSLHPGGHFALGLEAYTQVTSPLRRYADLVQQRQLAAHLAGEAPPYSAEDLLKVLATVEATDQEMKRVEIGVTQRWAMELVGRGPREGLEGWIVGETATGYKVQLASCGAVGLLGSRQKKSQHELGQRVVVDVEELKPRRGLMRLRVSS